MTSEHDVRTTHSGVTRHSEHGREWLICTQCGASWSVCESSDGEYMEEIDQGDGFCEDQEAFFRAIDKND